MRNKTSIHQSILQLEAWVCTLEGVTAANHQMGGREFLWQGKEIGHIHPDGDLDILFNKKIRDRLLENGLAEIHKWVPQSGWTTFHVSGEQLERAQNLLLLSYLHKRKRKNEKGQDQLGYIEKINLLPMPVSVISAAKE